MMITSLKRKEYYRKSKDKIIKQTNQYKVEKMKKDPIFKLERRLRNRVYLALKNQGKQKQVGVLMQLFLKD